jgi:hypothetical protein
MPAFCGIIQKKGYFQRGRKIMKRTVAVVSALLALGVFAGGDPAGAQEPPSAGEFLRQEEMLKEKVLEMEEEIRGTVRKKEEALEERKLQQEEKAKELQKNKDEGVDHLKGMKDDAEKEREHMKDLLELNQ